MPIGEEVKIPIDEKPFRDALELLSVEDDTLLPQGLSPEASQLIKTSRAWTGGSRVVGFGIGEKMTAGSRLDTVALKIYVTEKLPSARLEQFERIPPEVNIPDIANGLPTDVEAIGMLEPEILALRERPLIPGYSVGHVQENRELWGASPRQRVAKPTSFLATVTFWPAMDWRRSEIPSFSPVATTGAVGRTPLRPWKSSCPSILVPAFSIHATLR
jgi:hypothetical protein